MPFQARAIDDGAILLIRAVGQASAEDWYELDEHPPAGLEPPKAILIDLRPRESLPTAAVARDIGRRFEARHFTAVAVVARGGAQYGLARMVDALAGLRDKNVQVFEDIRVAREWLCGQRVEVA